jgi:hypothetical protein
MGKEWANKWQREENVVIVPVLKITTLKAMLLEKSESCLQFVS